MKKAMYLTVALLALICIVSCAPTPENNADQSNGVAYVRFGGNSSRSFDTNIELKGYNDVYWYYSAVKTDQYGFTGQTEFKEANPGTKGLPSGEIGPFSQGSWTFTLYAFSEVKNDKPANIETDAGLVYMGSVQNVFLTGGEVKNIPVSVTPQGDTGTISFKENDAWFEWGAEGGGDGKPVVTIGLDGSKPENSFTQTLTLGEKTPEGKYMLAGNLQINKDGKNTDKIPADYYTVTVRAFIPEQATNPSSTSLATEVFGLRVFGNATTFISGNIIESNFSDVSFEVPEQEMTIVSNVNSIATIGATPVGDKTKETSVNFGNNIPAIDNATHFLSVEVTNNVQSNQKFSAIAENGTAAVAGISLNLTKVSNEGSFVISQFDSPVTITTYIGKNLPEPVRVFYNGSQQEEISGVTYEPETGKLVFSTNHFSEYYVVAKVEALNETTGMSYVTLEEAMASAGDGHTVKLINDAELKERLILKKSLSLNLNNKTLNITYRSKINNNEPINTGTLLLNDENSYQQKKVELIIKNGNIKALERVSKSGLNGVFYVNSNSSLTLDHVHMETDESSIGIMQNQKDVEVKIIESTLINKDGAYIVSTNAGHEVSENIAISIEQSKLKSGNTAVLFNVKGSVSIVDSTVEGCLQSVFLRGGNHFISNSTLIAGGFDYTSNPFLDEQWKSGNNAPLSVLVIGNRTPNSYLYPTTVNLDNVELKYSDRKPCYGTEIHIWQNNDTPQCKVTVSGSVKSVNNPTVNAFTNGATVNLSGLAQGVSSAKNLEDSLRTVDPQTKLVLTNSFTTEKPFSIDKDIAIDLNGNNITGKSSRVFNVKAGTLSLLGNGIVESTGPNNDSFETTSSVIRVGSNEGTNIVEAGLNVGKDITIKGLNSYGVSVFGNKSRETVVVDGKIESNLSAISGNGSTGFEGTDITINSTANLKSIADCGIYHPQSGKLTVNGAIVEGLSAIEAKAGTIEINNAKLTATGSVDHIINNSGASSRGYALAVVENSGYAGDVEAVINSGNISGKIGKLQDSANPGKTYNITVYANPENVNAVVNSMDSGKIILQSGIYNDGINISHSKYVSSVQPSGHPIYTRNIKDLTIEADGEVVLKKDLVCTSSHMYDESTFDPVKEELGKYYSKINIDGLNIKGLNFEDDARIEFANQQQTNVSNVKISNCKLTKVDRHPSDIEQAVRFLSDDSQFHNIVFENLNISGYFQGIYIQNADNLLVKDCTISDAGHNFISVQNGASNIFTGKIEIVNNILSKTSDRAFKFGNSTNATITVANNTISKGVDTDNQLLETGTLTNCTYSFTGNTYEGRKLDDINNQTSSPWIVTVPTL